MKLKVVTYKIAKIIKELGYPQDYEFGDSWCYENGQFPDENTVNPPLDGWLLCPSYVEVWLWLWKNKKIELTLNYGQKINDVDETLWCTPLTYHTSSHPNMKYLIYDMHQLDIAGKCSSSGHNHKHADPEEAIINTINFLSDNNIIH